MTSNTISGNQSSTTNGNNKNTWQLARASVDGLAQAIESGKTEALASYLGVMARFPSYSARNALLIAAQRPNATRIEGVRSWNELGRFVRPGEKGIFIFAPAVGTKPNNQPQAQPQENGKKAKGKKAAEAAAEQAAQPEPQLLGFRGVYVFDIAQTGGEELAESHKPIDLAEALDKLTTFAQSRDMTVQFASWIAPKKATSYRGTVRLLPDMKPVEAFPALLREVANQTLYQAQRRTFVSRAIHEQETHAVAFVVCEALGLESKTAFANCQLYYGDSRLLGESLELVHRTAARILGALRPEGFEPEFTEEVR